MFFKENKLTDKINNLDKCLPNSYSDILYNIYYISVIINNLLTHFCIISSNIITVIYLFI